MGNNVFYSGCLNDFLVLPCFLPPFGEIPKRSKKAWLPVFLYIVGHLMRIAPLKLGDQLLASWHSIYLWDLPINCEHTSWSQDVSW